MNVGSLTIVNENGKTVLMETFYRYPFKITQKDDESELFATATMSGIDGCKANAQVDIMMHDRCSAR